MEVFNLFSGLVRQEVWSRLEKARQQQSLVLNMRITMPNPTEGGTRLILHELKIISANESRYLPSSTMRAVDLSASQLQTEYRRKARDANRLNVVREGDVGRVEAKLILLGKVRGLVAGRAALIIVNSSLGRD